MKRARKTRAPASTEIAGAAVDSAVSASLSIRLFFEPFHGQLLIWPGREPHDRRLAAELVERVKNALDARAAVARQSLAEIARAVPADGLTITYEGHFTDLEELVSELRSLIVQIETAAPDRRGEGAQAGGSGFGFVLKAVWTRLVPLPGTSGQRRKVAVEEEAISARMGSPMPKERVPSPARMEPTAPGAGAVVDPHKPRQNLSKIAARYQAYQQETRQELEQLLTDLAGRRFPDNETRREITLGIRETLRQAKLAVACPKCSRPGIIDLSNPGGTLTERYVVRHGTTTCPLKGEEFPATQVVAAPPKKARKPRQQPRTSAKD